MTNEIIYCDRCGRKNIVNPKKHKTRAKLCTGCRNPLGQPTGKPSIFIDLQRLEKKFNRLKERAFSKPSVQAFKRVRIADLARIREEKRVMELLEKNV